MVPNKFCELCVSVFFSWEKKLERREKKLERKTLENEEKSNRNGILKIIVASNDRSFKLCKSSVLQILWNVTNIV